jgi:hypothetical protein
LCNENLCAKEDFYLCNDILKQLPSTYTDNSPGNPLASTLNTDLWPSLPRFNPSPVALGESSSISWMNGEPTNT